MPLLKKQKFIDLLVMVGLVIIAGLIRVFYPAEILWDLVNYHYYNAWAFFHHRLGYDIAPAMVNTYFNPLIDVPYYLMLNHWPDMPALVRFCQGAYYGILAFVFYKICLLFFDFKKEPTAFILTILVAATGYSILSQAGTSSNEIQVSILILLGFYLIVKHISDNERKNTVWIYSGLLMGCALGLKPTVITCCVAMGLSLILFMKPLNVSLKEIMIFAMSGLAGYLIINGWWMWQLYDHFDNPFFPFLNKIFKSEYYDLINFHEDRHILKTTWLQKLWLPLLITFGSLKEDFLSETAFFDLRYALTYIISILLFIKWLYKGRKLPDCKYVLLYAFIVISFYIWAYLFSTMRYVIPIEMLSAIIIVKFFQKIKSENILIGAIVISIKIIGVYTLLTEIPDNLKAWKINDVSLINEFEFLKSVNLPDNALVKTYGYPSSMIAALLIGDQSNRIISFTNGDAGQRIDFINYKKLKYERERIEAQHRGPILALVVSDLYDRDEFYERFHNAKFRNSLLEKEGFYCRTFYSYDTIDICVSGEYKDQVFNTNNGLSK